MNAYKRSTHRAKLFKHTSKRRQRARGTRHTSVKPTGLWPNLNFNWFSFLQSNKKETEDIEMSTLPPNTLENSTRHKSIKTYTQKSIKSLNRSLDTSSSSKSLNKSFDKRSQNKYNHKYNHKYDFWVKKDDKHASIPLSRGVHLSSLFK